jgi:hypothetical protein
MCQFADVLSCFIAVPLQQKKQSLLKMKPTIGNDFAA